MSYQNYYKHLRDAALDQSLVGDVKNSDLSLKATNFSCQDSIELNIRLDALKENVEECRYKATGCLLSQASSAILVGYIKAKNLKTLKELSVSKIFEILGVEEKTTRNECFLLPWNLLLEHL